MTLTLNREQLQFFSHSSRLLLVGTVRQAGEVDERPVVLTVGDEMDLTADLHFTALPHGAAETLEIARTCLRSDHPGTAFLALIYLSQQETEADFQHAAQVFSDRHHVRSCYG